MDILSQSSLLVALTSFALGFSVLARNARNKLFLAFAAVCLLVCGWSLSFVAARMSGSEGTYRLHLLLNVWLAPVILVLIRVMVRIHQDPFSRRLLGGSIAAAATLTVALALGLDSVPWILQAMYFAPALVVVQTVQLMWIDRRLRRGLKRLPKLPTVGFARRNLIYLGILIVLCTSVMDHVPWMGEVIPSLGNLGLTVHLFFVSQAITQARLLNFGALASRFLVLTAVALTLTAIYSLLVAWVEGSPGLFVLNSFIASFLILVLLDPLRAVVGYFTQRLLTQKHQRLLKSMREAQLRLAGITEPGALFQAVLMFAEEALQPRWAALFVLRSDGTRYRRVRTLGTEPGGDAPAEASDSKVPSHPPLREVLANHALLQHCERLRKRGDLPILLDQIVESEIDRSASRVQREHLAGLLQSLKALGANLLIPLVDPTDGAILAFVALHVPAPPEPWGSNWGLLPILYPFFEQAAGSMRNMEVYVRSREKDRLAALGEMAAGLAHEIRNPLGAIKGAAQYLDPSAARPESRFLKVIVEEVDRLNRVVTQFLDYSKPFAAELRHVGAASLVEKTLDHLRPGLRPELKLELRVSPAAQGARLLCSPEQLQQVVINLIQNSQKALEGRPSGRIVVAVDSEGVGPGRETVVTVEDDGPGIRREHLDKIFIPFFTTSPSGTGLGLSICQKIVEAHRGRIEVSSDEGRYTRFTVVLPEAEAQTQA